MTRKFPARLLQLADRRSTIASYPYIAILRPEGADHGPCQSRSHFHRGKSRPCGAQALYLRIAPDGQQFKLCAHHAPPAFGDEDSVLDERGRNSSWRLGLTLADPHDDKD